MSNAENGRKRPQFRPGPLKWNQAGTAVAVGASFGQNGWQNATSA
jgi:hypothetical protein